MKSAHVRSNSVSLECPRSHWCCCYHKTCLNTEGALYNPEAKECKLSLGKTPGHPAASCQEIRDLLEDTKRTDGIFWITFDGYEKQGVPVYCRIASDIKGAAWTLIQSASYSIYLAKGYIGYSAFTKDTYFQTGRNELTDSSTKVNLKDYIMRRRRAMKMVNSHGTADRWRITCNMDNSNDASDLAEALYDDFNIFRYNAAECTVLVFRQDFAAPPCH